MPALDKSIPFASGGLAKLGFSVGALAADADLSGAGGGAGNADELLPVAWYGPFMCKKRA